MGTCIMGGPSHCKVEEEEEVEEVEEVEKEEVEKEEVEVRW